MTKVFLVSVLLLALLLPARCLPWCAEHLRDRLGPILDASFTKSELAFMLVLVANEQPLRAPGANWARYYAKFFLGLYG